MARIEKSSEGQPVRPQVHAYEEKNEVMDHAALSDAIETYIHLMITYLTLFHANKNITDQELQGYLDKIDTLSDLYQNGQIEALTLVDELYAIGSNVLFPKLDLTTEGAIVSIHTACKAILNNAHTLFNRVYKEQHNIPEEKLTYSPLDHWKIYDLDNKRPMAVFESIFKAASGASKEFGIPLTILEELEMPTIPPWLNLPMAD